MAYWLVKTEPSSFSYADLERQRRVVWDGVKNSLALMHLRGMKKGDQAFIYHSGSDKAVVGIAAVASDPYADPRGGDPRFVVVDLVPSRRLARRVSLAAIKAEAEFAGFALVRMSRLSVMPVPPAAWERLLAMAG
jgi:predicted RNA-binding protein with PUA-like domain